jgi:hypothetical protein
MFYPYYSHKMFVPSSCSYGTTNAYNDHIASMTVPDTMDQERSHNLDIRKACPNVPNPYFFSKLPFL